MVSPYVQRLRKLQHGLWFVIGHNQKTLFVNLLLFLDQSQTHKLPTVACVDLEHELHNSNLKTIKNSYDFLFKLVLPSFSNLIGCH